MRDIGVIYLCRFAEGEEPVRRFLRTYRNHAAGVDHDLHIVFKGFEDRASFDSYRMLFDGVDINAIVIEDSGFDLGAYAQAAQLVSNRRLIFLNTFSQIRGMNWLDHFNRVLDQPGVGIVGATGSLQSNPGSYERTLYRVGLRIFDGLARYMGRRNAVVGASLPLTMQSRSRWRYVFSPFYYVYLISKFTRYPNPHIRTNAFMLDRAQFLALKFPAFKKKEHALLFESGRWSLTRQLAACGLRAMVVGRNGQAYSADQWRASGTFWSGNQSNLLIADNRTCEYDESSPEMRSYLEHLAWVDPWAPA
jgi:hypothetical protein